jgi:hypothetical protein
LIFDLSSSSKVYKYHLHGYLGNQQTHKQFLYLRKEINLLAKTAFKKKILEMYASVIKKEQAKLDGSQKPEKRRKIVAPKSKSDDEMSVQVICAPLKKPKKKSTINTLDLSAVEMD